VKAKIFAIFFITLAVLESQSDAAPTTAIYNKIISQGVPADALNRMVKFLDESKGRSFQQDVYTCAKLDPESVKPCEESERTNSTRTVKIALKKKVEYTDLPKSMPVKRDLALLIDAATTFADVETVIRNSEKRLHKSVTLFDVYEGKNLEAGKKSYAVSMTLQDDEKTLNDKQIDAVMKKIITNLQKQLGAQLR
jgi:hypothetical protein